MPPLNETDLEARLCRALDLAKKTVRVFASNGYTDSKNPAYSFGPEKLIAETTMLIYAASSSRQRPNVADRIDELALLLAPHARSERVMVDIALHPSVAFKFAVPHILLARLGYSDAGFDDFLRSCVLAQVSNAHDRSPSASLERRWISSLWTGEGAELKWRAGDLTDAILNWPIDTIGGLRDDAYAFTHQLFYWTDFGFRVRRLPRTRSSILAEAESLLARYVDAEDYDLAGEVLLAWPLTRAKWSPSSVFCFRVLASVEDQVGVLPCGNVDMKRLTGLEGDDRARYALGTAYHTAYVMGFICAASLRRDMIPPSDFLGPRCDETYLSRLRGYLEDDQGHWQSEFSSLAEHEKQVLAPLILDIAIVQKIRKHDYDAVGRLLSLACEYGAAKTPMCGQAAELLERIKRCSTAIVSRRTKGGEKSAVSGTAEAAL